MTWEGRLKFYVSSADPDAAPVWVDLTSRIRDAIQPLDQFVGRQDDVNDSQPGQLALLLDNSDGALTFGNTSSPYALWWGPGRKCYLTEKVTSAVTQDRFTGYIQMPQENLVTHGMEMWVQITAVDRLGRLAQGKPFISTLAAQVLANATTLGLNAYWPLVSSSGLAPAPVGSQVPLSINTVRLSFLTPTEQPSYSFDGPAVTADDLATLQLNPNVVSSSVAIEIYPSGPINPISISSTTVAMTVWLYIEDLPTSDYFFQIDDNAGPTDLLNLQRSGGSWSFGASIGASNVSVSTDPLAAWKWNMLTLRMTLPSGLVEMWVNDRPAQSGTLSGSPPSSTTFSGFTMAEGVQGNVAHLQVYLGTSFNRTAHLAQYQHGLIGLERQTTGARVQTILGYAGVPTSEYTGTIDTGTSVMQRAQLAGKDPLTALREAETTEQGLLYVDGSGNTHFADRRTLSGI